MFAHIIKMLLGPKIKGLRAHNARTWRAWFVVGIFKFSEKKSESIVFELYEGF
jgi:hypothetical protein